MSVFFFDCRTVLGLPFNFTRSCRCVGFSLVWAWRTSSFRRLTEVWGRAKVDERKFLWVDDPRSVDISFSIRRIHGPTDVVRPWLFSCLLGVRSELSCRFLFKLHTIRFTVWSRGPTLQCTLLLPWGRVLFPSSPHTPVLTTSREECVSSGTRRGVRPSTCLGSDVNPKNTPSLTSVSVGTRSDTPLI